MNTAPRIVVIDDDPDHLDMLVTLLERHGFATAGFTDARDALYHLIDNPASVAVVDLCMPDLNGVELVQRLQTSRPELPVIAMSGHEEAGPTLRVMRDYGAVAAVRKPIVPTGFIQAIKNAIAFGGAPAKRWALV